MFPKNSPSGASVALALALVASLSAPRPARAADTTVLRPVLEVEQGFDSNFRNQSNSNEGSLVTTLSPGLWIENSGELGSARLGVTAVARSIWQDSNISGVDENARGAFERKVTPRLTLFGDGLYDYYSGYEEIGQGGPTSPAGLPGEVILAASPSWRHDQLGGGLRYLLTPFTALRISGSGGRVNYERSNVTLSTRGEYRDRNLLNGRAALEYQLTPLDELTLSVDSDDTSYQDLGTGTNDSEIWSSQLAWYRNWSPVWSTVAAIGLSQTDSTQKDVPQTGGSQVGPVELASKSFSASGTGLIGSLSIARSFERSALRLSYDRDTRSTGGSGRTNFDVDSFTLAATHQLAERVKLTVSGNYSLYHSVTSDMPNYAAQMFGTTPSCVLGGTPTQVGNAELPAFPGFLFPVYQCLGGSSKETRTYTSLLARLDWRVRRHLNAYVITRYYHALTDQTLGTGAEFETENLDKFTVGLGFRYTWDLEL